MLYKHEKEKYTERYTVGRLINITVHNIYIRVYYVYKINVKLSTLLQSLAAVAAVFFYPLSASITGATFHRALELIPNRFETYIPSTVHTM